MKHLDKVPLIISMYGSSVLIGISTFASFPSEDFILKYSVSIIGALTYDLVMTVTVFSKKKNGFSYITILAAFLLGLFIALDLYLKWNLTWLHATYILLSSLFALHLATTTEHTREEKVKEIPTVREDKRLLKSLLSKIPNKSAQIVEEKPSVAIKEEITEKVIEQNTEKKYKYQCPTCHKKLYSRQEEAAAERLNGCKDCRKKRV